MNVLLDTHAFLWLDSEQTKLSETAEQVCTDAANKLWLSTASVWEMEIKMALGKLRLRRPLSEIIRSQQTANGIQILPVQLAHALELENLPSHHKDPFDRMLIAQVKSEAGRS